MKEDPAALSSGSSLGLTRERDLPVRGEEYLGALGLSRGILGTTLRPFGTSSGEFLDDGGVINEREQFFALKSAAD